MSLLKEKCTYIELLGRRATLAAVEPLADKCIARRAVGSRRRRILHRLGLLLLLRRGRRRLLLLDLMLLMLLVLLSHRLRGQAARLWLLFTHSREVLGVDDGRVILAEGRVLA